MDPLGHEVVVRERFLLNLDPLKIGEDEAHTAHNIIVQKTRDLGKL